MDQNQAIQLWAKLSEEGKAPTELMEASRVLPELYGRYRTMARPPRK